MTAEHRHVRGVEVHVGEAIDVGEARALPALDVDGLVVLLGHPRHRRAVRHVRTGSPEQGERRGASLAEPRELAGVEVADATAVEVALRGHLGSTCDLMRESMASSVTFMLEDLCSSGSDRGRAE